MECFDKYLLPHYDTGSILDLIVIVIFVGLIILTRISGFITFAKMASFYFACTIAIGSILASVSIDPKTLESYKMFV
jgi:uncharacterized membrane protein YcaP (DUF421 family)